MARSVPNLMPGQITSSNIGYSQWRIITHEKFYTLKQIPQARKTIALNRHCLEPGSLAATQLTNLYNESKDLFSYFNCSMV